MEQVSLNHCLLHSTLLAKQLLFEKVKGLFLNNLDRQIESIRPEDAFSAKRSKFDKRGKQESTSFASKKGDSKQE